MMEQYETQEKLRLQGLRECLKNGIKDHIFRRQKFYDPDNDPRATATTWWMQILMKNRPQNESLDDRARAVSFFRDKFKGELSQIRNNRQTACKLRFPLGKYPDNKDV